MSGLGFSDDNQMQMLQDMELDVFKYIYDNDAACSQPTAKHKFREDEEQKVFLQGYLVGIKMPTVVAYHRLG